MYVDPQHLSRTHAEYRHSAVPRSSEKKSERRPLGKNGRQITSPGASGWACDIIVESRLDVSFYESDRLERLDRSILDKGCSEVGGRGRILLKGSSDTYTVPVHSLRIASYRRQHQLALEHFPVRKRQPYCTVLNPLLAPSAYPPTHPPTDEARTMFRPTSDPSQPHVNSHR